MLTEIIGYIASICMVLGYLPQTIQTIRTRSTDDIALGTFQGYLLGNWPLFLCNLCTTAMSTIIFSIKMKNDYFSHKKTK